MAPPVGVWKLRQHAPSWILQGLCAIILGVIGCLLIGASSVVISAGHGDDNFAWLGYYVENIARFTVILGSLLLVFSTVTVLLCVVEFLLYRRKKLSPTFLLTSACIKLVLWMAYLVFVCFAAVKGSPSPLDLVLGIILVVTTVGQIVLATNYVIRQRRDNANRGRYKDVEGGQSWRPSNMAMIPRSKTWRASVPMITITSREFNAEDMSYENFRNAHSETEDMRQQRRMREIERALRRPSTVDDPETQTLASTEYEESTTTWTLATPPQSPAGLTHPPVIGQVYSQDHMDEFDQADISLTGFYGSTATEGETRRH